MQLSDPSGDVVAYLKCGWNESARLRMRREYEVLRRLPSGLGPTALRYACADGCDLLLTTAIAGSTLTPALPPPAELRGFLRGLDQGRAAGLGQHPALGTLPTSWPAVDRCLEALSSREWSVVIQHGDLTPWNLIRNPEGRLSAIDWEYGHLDGMPGLDLAHHILQIGLFIYRWPPRRTIEYAVRFLLRDDSGSLGPGEAAALVRLGAAQAYAHAEHDGAPGHHPLQRWRRAVWEAA